MRRLDILVDMDNILCDHIRPSLEAFNRLLMKDGAGYKLEVEDIVDYNWFTFLPEHLHDRAMNEWKRPGFYRRLRPLDGAIDAVRTMHNGGHRVHIVSAAVGGLCVDEKIEWLKKHLTFLPLDRLHLCWNKEIIAGDVLLDDKPSTVRAYRKRWPDALVTGVRWPYNTSEPGMAEGWKDESTAWLTILGMVASHAGM